MPTINVNGAAARLLATGALAKAGLCLHYSWLAIGQGKVHYLTGGADTAYNTWLAVPADHQHSSRIVPKDFPAFLGKKFLSAAGDVIISNGDGTFVATDWPKSRQVGVCTLEQREKQTGRKFVGWASSMGGYELESTTTAGSESGTPITEQFGEDMKLVEHHRPAIGAVATYAVENGEITLVSDDPKFSAILAVWGPPIRVDDDGLDGILRTLAKFRSLRPATVSAPNTPAPTVQQIANELAKRLSA